MSDFIAGTYHHPHHRVHRFVAVAAVVIPKFRGEHGHAKGRYSAAKERGGMPYERMAIMSTVLIEHFMRGKHPRVGRRRRAIESFSGS